MAGVLHTGAAAARAVPRVVLLGTAAALPSAERDNTAMAFVGAHSTMLVDCPGAAYAKLLRAGVDPGQVTHLLLTHRHTDHCGGLPGFLQSAWLGGRAAPLPILALPDVQAHVDRAIDTYQPFGDRTPFALPRVTLPEAATNAPVLETDDFRVWTAPGDHSVPAVAVRVEARASGVAIVYSSDTRPSPVVANLASGATLLLHEATFGTAEAEQATRFAHSTTAQAAEIGRRAGATWLALVHYTPSAAGDLAARDAEARAVFGERVLVPDDLAAFGF